jgi:hypothetical protein
MLGSLGCYSKLMHEAFHVIDPISEMISFSSILYVIVIDYLVTSNLRVGVKSFYCNRSILMTLRTSVMT